MYLIAAFAGLRRGELLARTSNVFGHRKTRTTQTGRRPRAPGTETSHPTTSGSGAETVRATWMIPCRRCARAISGAQKAGILILRERCFCFRASTGGLCS
jgi:hypothetical protein